MRRLNNKGQSLVMFVMLIPLFMVILVLVFDVGNMISLKLELNSINKIVISYGLDDVDKDNLELELNDLIIDNNSDIDDINIEILDNKIDITLSDYSKSIFGKIVGLDGYEVISEYVGYIDDGNKRIEKVK